MDIKSNSSLAQKKEHELGLFRLIAVTLAFVMSIRNLPMLAETGWPQIFYMILAAVIFQIPVALLSAELATGFSSEGGAYSWIKQAFGKKWGFVGAWMFWAMMCVGMVMVASFIAAMIAYVFDPQLASNKFFIMGVSLICIWFPTIYNLRGLKASTLISAVGYFVGVAIPFVLIILFGAIWYFGGHAVDMAPLTWENAFPDFSKINNLVFFTGIILLYSGSEAVAVHAPQTKNVQKNFPKAMIVATLLLLVLNVIGALSIQMVVPANEIGLASGIMQTFHIFFTKMNVSWMTPVVALLIGFGAFGQLTTWLLGPSKSMLAVAKDGNMPEFFHRTNAQGMPVVFMILQAVILSAVTLVYLLVPTINAGFFMVLVLSVLLYSITYILIFASAIRLRYTFPDVKRAYRVPGGKAGIWILGSMGIFAMLLCLVLGIFPPSSLPTEHQPAYVIFELGGLLLFLAVPFGITYYMKRRELQAHSGDDIAGNKD
ncbi:MAG: amino acid permease [Bacteroidales bacterium]